MPLEGNLEYALTRVHARYGMRLTESTWRRLAASRDAGHYLEAARTTALAPWVAALDVTRDTHAIERALRNEWRHYVVSVALWHPLPWQPWLGWLRWLPSLSLLADLTRDASLPEWLLADPVCGPLALGSPADRLAALKRSTLAPLAPALSGRASLAQAWRAEWQRLAPASNGRTRRLQAQLLAILERHAQALLRAEESSSPLMQELAKRLSTLFRAAADSVVASVCHLALLSLDLERLRGNLVSRRLFGSRRELTEVV